MAKQKSFHEKVVQKLKRDAGFAWTGDFLYDMRALVEGSTARDIRSEHPIVGEGFIASLQQEAIIRASDEELRRASGKGLDDPFIYPGLMAAWEAEPTTVDFEPGVLERALEADPDFYEIPADAIRSLFPACLMFDIRGWGLELYGSTGDALFVYPSFDDERKYELLLAVGVSARVGLHMPFESKLVMEGDSLADVLVFSIGERERMRGRCLAGIDQGLHDEVFSPFEDEEKVLMLLSLLLGVMLWDGAEIMASERRGVPHWHVALKDAAGEGPEGATPDERAADDQAGDAPTAVPERRPEDDSDGEEPDGGSAVEEPAAVGEEPAETASQAASPALSNDTPGPDEAIRLRDLLAAQESKSATLEYHLKQARTAVDDARREATGAAARAAVLETMELPQTPSESLALAERAFPDRLVFMPSARKSASEFRKGSAAEVWAVLRSIAMVLHPLVFGRGGGNIMRAFQDESGFEVTLREMKMIKQSGEFSRLRTVEYKGAERDASAHVKGRSSRKGEALRVHFFADYDEPGGRIVVTHCGEHLETYVTPSL
ncbi:MAG: hypothetical protein IJ111_01055 [Eggerthellaceae bacterium]|nr:hypothetical protein [Eggerthellaceae bacterium]